MHVQKTEWHEEHQCTDANVGKGETVRVNIDKEGASGVKKNTSDVVLAVTKSCRCAMEDFCTCAM